MRREDIKRSGPGGKGADAAPLELHALASAGRQNSAISQRPMPEPVTLSPKLDALDLPQPPEGMAEEGKQLWHEVMPWLVEVNVLQSIDLAAFAGMCDVFAQAQKAKQVLDAQGYFSLGSGGQLTEHPAMKIYQTSQMMFLRFAAEFGMTTLARTRLGLLDASRKSIQQDLDWTLGPSTRRTEADVESTG